MNNKCKGKEMIFPIGMIAVVGYIILSMWLNTLAPGAVDINDLKVIEGVLIDAKRVGRAGGRTRFVIRDESGEEIALWGVSATSLIGIKEYKDRLGLNTKAYYVDNPSILLRSNFNMNDMRHLEINGEMIIDSKIININMKKSAEKGRNILFYGTLSFAILVIFVILYVQCFKANKKNNQVF